MSLQQIKVAREQILTIVKENKKKHDEILKDAIEGYWIEAEKHLKKYEKDTIASLEKNHKAQLKAMRKNLKEQKKSIREQTRKEFDHVDKRRKDGPWVYMRNPYPQSHTDDYVGTIRRLELSVDKDIELNDNEFDRYVRNKWEWRDQFVYSNSNYVVSARTSPSYANNISGTFVTNALYCATSSYSMHPGVSTRETDSSGKVGIGMDTPKSSLSVGGNISKANYTLTGSILGDVENF